MALDVESLEPRIYQILSAPGTDLGTISAKRVRKQLLELDPSLTAEALKENKEAVDAVIASVFERVSGEQGSASDDDGTNHTKEEADEDSPDDLVNDRSTTPKKKKKKGSKQEQADAELARKLSSEINGRSTRTTGKGRGGSGTTKKAARTKKSAATVDSDDGSGNEGGKKKTKKRSNGTGAKGGFAKEFALSEPLSIVLQTDKLSRPQVVKQLWDYIKGGELQNPSNKREILCDSNLKAVFGVEKIDMFKMNKILGQHLHEIE